MLMACGYFTRTILALLSDTVHRCKIVQQYYPAIKNLRIIFLLQQNFNQLHQIDGLVQERHNSIANALELHLSCTNPSKYNSKIFCEIGPMSLLSLAQTPHVALANSCLISVHQPLLLATSRLYWDGFLLQIGWESVCSWSSISGYFTDGIKQGANVCPQFYSLEVFSGIKFIIVFWCDCL